MIFFVISVFLLRFFFRGNGLLLVLHKVGVGRCFFLSFLYSCTFSVSFCIAFFFSVECLLNGCGFWFAFF